MKVQNPKRYIMIVLGVCLLFLLVKALVPQKKIVLDQTNKVFVAKGDVRVRKAAAGAAWQKVEASTVFEKGDVVETGDDSTVDIVMGTEADKAIKVKGKSHLALESINPTEAHLTRGEAMVAIRKLERGSSFVVKTPAAICGARGTAWLMQAGDTATKVSVFESTVAVQAIDARGRGTGRRHLVTEGTQRVLAQNEPIGKAGAIAEKDLADWNRWQKTVSFLGDGKILINDFNSKENFNNLDGDVGSWNAFPTDTTQYCRDEFSDRERVGDTGYGLKLAYDVNSRFSAYNGFFTKLMGIDISGCKYLVFSVKGDAAAGFTRRINIELKTKRQTGRATVEGITDTWSKVVVPLGRFVGINDFTAMDEFVIVFSDINVTAKEGVLYIDDIYFSKTEPV